MILKKSFLHLPLTGTDDGRIVQDLDCVAHALKLSPFSSLQVCRTAKDACSLT